MSLRETYQSRKNLLAINLRQKGVTASGTEGLTTLINKVLDINTISFDGITLNSDKDIISYNGGTQPESAVLTAQLTLDGDPALVSGETVTFEVRKDSDDSLVETLTGTTNSSGVATVSYLGKGVGDLYVKAILRSFVSETYSIRDIYYANIGTTDKSSDFDTTNLKVLDNKTKGTISITNDGEKYTVTSSGFGNQVLIPIPKLNGLTSNYKFKVIIKSLGGLIVYNTPVILARVDGNVGRLVYSSNWASPDWNTKGQITTLDNNSEYELELISNGSTFTLNILDLNGTVLGSWNYTNNSLNNSTNTVYLGIWAMNGTCTLRNLTLELL